LVNSKRAFFIYNFSIIYTICVKQKYLRKENCISDSEEKDDDNPFDQFGRVPPATDQFWKIPPATDQFGVIPPKYDQFGRVPSRRDNYPPLE
jgi:hypothetical protein